MHNLRSNYYSFSSTSGAFDNRFKLHYTSNALGISDQDNMNTFSYINNSILNVQSTKNIELVEIYDISGKLIKSCPLSDAKQNFETDFIA